MCYAEIALCNSNIEFIIGSIMNIIGKIYESHEENKKENILLWSSFKFLYPNSDSKTWNDNLSGSTLLVKNNDSPSNQMLIHLSKIDTRVDYMDHHTTYLARVVSCDHLQLYKAM